MDPGRGHDVQGIGGKVLADGFRAGSSDMDRGDNAMTVIKAAVAGQGAQVSCQEDAQVVMGSEVK